MMRIAALLLAALLAATGCTTTPGAGGDGFTGLLSPADEQRIGAEQHPILVRQFGGEYPDPRLAAYLRAVGERVAAASGEPPGAFTFTILNDPTVNAFSLPGGYVHVTRGLLALASDEAELAGVLAHEIAHVTARHAAERYGQAVAASAGAAVIAVLAGAAGVPAGELAQLGAEAYLQAYSRDQEFEADMVGVRTLARAGYDPEAMATFLDKLAMHARIEAAAAGDPSAADRTDIFASHPRTADRVAQAVRAAGAARTGEQRRGEADYLTAIDGLVYGDDPAQGVRVGRDFLHPELRIGFRVPPGFTMHNTPSHVLARGPQGALLVFDMAPLEAARATRDLAAYVAEDWGAKLALKGIERMTVDGMDGATGANRIQTKGGIVDVRLVAIRERPDRIYRFLLLVPPALSDRLTPALRESTYSFRRLSADEAASIRPLRLRIVTVKPGETARELAARLPFESNRLEHFLALNGRRVEAALEPGAQVKIITR